MGHLGFPLPRRAGWPGSGPPPRGKPRVLLDGVDVPAMPRDDVHAGRGEAPGPGHGDVRQRARGGELRHLDRFARRSGRDADRFRARVIGIDREGSRFFLSHSDTAEEVWKGDPFLVTTGGERGVRSGSNLFVPLLHQGKPIGLLKLGERKDGKPFGERELHMARIIADYAAGALNTVDRLGRIEKVSLRDPETGAYSAAFLADYFEKERYKAVRFHRPLSVVFLVVENFAFLVEQTRESIVVGALTSMITTVRRAVRDSDLVAREEANRSASSFRRPTPSEHCSPFDGSERR